MKRMLAKCLRSVQEHGDGEKGEEGGGRRGGRTVKEKQEPKDKENMQEGGVRSEKDRERKTRTPHLGCGESQEMD